MKELSIILAYPYSLYVITSCESKFCQRGVVGSRAKRSSLGLRQAKGKSSTRVHSFEDCVK